MAHWTSGGPRQIEIAEFHGLWRDRVERQGAGTAATGRFEINMVTSAACGYCASPRLVEDLLTQAHRGLPALSAKLRGACRPFV